MKLRIYGAYTIGLFMGIAAALPQVNFITFCAFTFLSALFVGLLTSKPAPVAEIGD